MNLDVACDPGCPVPIRAHATDAGLDLTAVRLVSYEGTTRVYDTGVRIRPSKGWYVEVVPRSSIHKYGLVLANSVGVLDPDYRGTVRLVFYKVDPSRPDPDLPARLAQLLPRRLVDVRVQTVDALDDTARGDGGFGSTGR